jgi:hypothetical protein
MFERVVARLHLLRPLAFQLSVAVSPALLLVALLGVAGGIQAFVGGLAGAWLTPSARRGFSARSGGSTRTDDGPTTDAKT